ncbi:MAG: M23 family metallopeptidase [Bacilli bacterium]|nr:M23 family metallopeptidase [Bacilli bacterium]
MEESKFYNKENSKAKKTNKFLYRFITKILICLILFISFLIVIKINPKLKDKIYQVVYEDHFSFAYVNNLYKKYFGSVLPFENIAPTEEVFNEKITYDTASVYKDGVVLEVSNNYLVPVIESGIVVFIGDKEGYGNTIIVQQTNGVDVWYGNIISTDIKIYDYIEKGTLLGEVTGNKIYLVFQKEGKYLNYKEYI